MGGEKKGVSIGPSSRSEVIRPNKGPSVWIERGEGSVRGGQIRRIRKVVCAPQQGIETRSVVPGLSMALFGGDSVCATTL